MTISKDLFSGLIFLLVGGFVTIEGAGYEMGTLLRMGPGYFPVMIGALMLLVGSALVVKGLMPGAEPLPQFSFRPLLFLLAAILAFALALEQAGLIVATLLLIGIGRFAAREPMSWKGTLALAAALIAAGAGIFRYLLELPMPLWPWS